MQYHLYICFFVYLMCSLYIDETFLSIFLSTYGTLFHLLVLSPNLHPKLCNFAIGLGHRRTEKVPVRICEPLPVYLTGAYHCCAPALFSFIKFSGTHFIFKDPTELLYLGLVEKGTLCR